MTVSGHGSDGDDADGGDGGDVCGDSTDGCDDRSDGSSGVDGRRAVMVMMAVIVSGDLLTFPPSHYWHGH